MVEHRHTDLLMKVIVKSVIKRAENKESGNQE